LKRNIFIALFVLGVLVGCGTVKTNEQATVQKVSCDNMKDLIKKENSFLVDVREPSEYEEEHLDGSINIPSTNINSITSNKDITKDSIIVVYCKSGNRSSDSANKLVGMGYKHVYDLGSINNCK